MNETRFPYPDEVLVEVSWPGVGPEEEEGEGVFY